MNTLSFSDRLLVAMDAEKLSQADLARRVGVSRAAINQVVSGATKGMKPDNLVAVARALNVRVEWLAMGEEPMRPEVITATDREVLRYLRGLPASRKQNLIALIRDISMSG